MPWWHSPFRLLRQRTINWELINNRNLFFLTVLEAGSPRSGCQHGWVLVTALFWAATGPFLFVSSHDKGQREKATLCKSSKDSNLTHDNSTFMTSSNPSYPPKVPPPDTITLGSGVFTWIWRYTNFHLLCSTYIC